MKLVIKEKSEEKDNTVEIIDEKETQEMTSTVFEKIKPCLIYTAFFAIFLLYFELIMMIENGGIKPSGFFFLFFILPESLFLALFCGWGNDLSGRIALPILTGIVSAGYIVQLLYLKIFGTIFSISMMGMGTEAVGGFGWALADTVKSSIGLLFLLLIPFIVSVLLSVFKASLFKKYHILIHVTAVVGVVFLWIMGIFGLRLFGDDRQSPFYLFTDSSVSTDAASKKLGVLTTALVEGGSYYFGIDLSKDNDLSQNISLEDFNLKVEEPKDENKTKTEIEPEKEIERNPWIDERIDFKSAIESTEDKDLLALDEYFSQRESNKTNEYTGLFEGYNLIYICAESFWSYACDEKVTPTLYKMANNGIVLTNYYNSFLNTTTNGEFAFATSLWPDVSRYSAAGTDVGSFPRSASIYMPQGLGDLFDAQGVPSYAFHNYYGKYYRRCLSWPNLGYSCKFTDDGMRFTSNWPASDIELMEQSVDDYINDDQFHAYYMTFSGHGSYTPSNYMYRKNIDEVTQKTIGKDYNDEALGYLCGEMEFDKAMEYLLKRLEEAGQLDKTVIVIAADHYPYHLSKEGRKSLTGKDIDDEFGIYKSKCIIYNAGIKDPIVNENYCCNVDIVPTMLNLFNIPYDSRLLMGHDVFDDKIHRAALFNQSFITDMVSYNYETGETIWSEKSQGFSENEKEKYLNNMITLVENEYTASCKIVSKNYFLHLYQASGILSDEEVKEEKNREAKVRAKDEEYNIEDELEKEQKALEEQALEEQMINDQIINDQALEEMVEIQ